MKKKYRLSTGLVTLREEPLFDNDKDAWEYLRKQLPSKFAVLYRQEEFPVCYNNAAEYVEIHNRKYGPPPIGYGPDNAEIKTVNDANPYKVWIPVLEGITDDEYSIEI